MRRMKTIKTSILQSVFQSPLDAKRCAKWAVIVIILAGIAPVHRDCTGQRRQRGAAVKIIQLPQPKLTGSLSFEELVVKLRMVRQLTNQSINFEQIGQLAWAGQGMLEQPSQGQNTFGGGQSMPQVQGIYPITLFFASTNGVFVYNPVGHNLEQIFDRDVRNALVPAVRNPEAVTAGGCNIIITGPVKDPAGRTTSATRRLALIQAGQSAQNIQLQAVSLNLASIPVSEFDSRNVVRICNLPRTMEVLHILSVGYPAETIGSGTAISQQPGSTTTPVQNRTAVLIVSEENFNDRELFETMQYLNAAGVQTIVASTRLGVVRGTMGGLAESATLINQLRTDDFNAVIFIGGDGAKIYFNNPDALNIAREAVAKGKVLAAISTAPAILANAGVLHNIRSTSYITEKSLLQQGGAIYTGNNVERDGLIITSSGPIAVVQFAAAIVEALAGR
jgi:protease I